MTSANRRRFDPRNIVFSYGFFIVLVLVFVIYSLATPSFLTVANVANILHHSSALLVIASGLTLVIMTGSLDISVGSVAFVSAAAGVALVSAYNLPTLVGILVIVLIGLGIGCVNGFLVTVAKINPLITTLGMMIALRGAGLHILGGAQKYIPDALRNFANIKIGPLFIDTIIALTFAVVLHIVLTRTTFGRHLAAIGNSADIASRIGIKVNRTMFLAFVLSGFLASVGGIISIMVIGNVNTYVGQQLEFIAVAAVVMGGTSLFGGEGSVIPGTLMGVITLIVIENGLNLIGASSFIYPFVRGIIIFSAMYADSLKTQIRVHPRMGAEERAYAGD